MKVELHDHLQRPLAVPATRVLITDDQGTPLCLCVQWGPRHTRVFRVGDPDFNDQLKMHGVTRTAVVSRVDTTKLVLGKA